MKIRIICSLRYVDCPNVEFESYSFYLNHGKETLDSNIFNEYTIGQIGAIFIREFLNNPFWVANLDIGNDHFETVVGKAFSHLGMLSNHLWFSKDNCVDIGHMYAFDSEADGKILAKYRTAPLSCADGEYKTVTITNEDLSLAYKVLHRIIEVQNKNDSGKAAPKLEVQSKPIISDTNYHYRNYNEHNRIQRALSFLSIARTNSFLALKISVYIAVLETLFTTDSIEVSYKVRQRVAFYLETEYESRMDIYQKVKEAYDIRSKFFHGQELAKNKDSRESLAKVSVNIDEVVRKVLTKVLFSDTDDFLKDNKSLEEYFNKLIF